MVQVWPSGDTFDHGSPVYGDNLTGYVGVRPKDTLYHNGTLHNGYGAGQAACAGDGASVLDKPCGFMRREMYDEDVEVEVVFSKIDKLGPVAPADSLHEWGVILRAQGGVAENQGTRDLYFRDGLAYVCKMVDVGSGQYELQIVRYLSAVEAVLAQRTFNNPGVPGKAIEGITMRASAFTLDTGDVRVQVVATSLSRMGPDIPIGSQSDGLSWGLNYTDAAAGAIVGDGRCGFAMDREELLSAPARRMVSLCHSFQVRDISGGVSGPVLWRDEWSRGANYLSEPLTDLHSTTGDSLQSDYSGDQHGEDALVSYRMTRDTSAERVEVAGFADPSKHIELNGSSQRLFLADYGQTFYYEEPSNRTAFTLSLWLDLDANKTSGQAHGIATFEPSGSPADARGWHAALVSTGGTNAKLVLKSLGATGATLVDSAEFDISAYIGTAHCWIITYRAQAIPATGEARARLWVGRNGSASLIVDELVDFSKQWVWPRNSIDAYLGYSPEASGSYLDGKLDHCRIFFEELTAATDLDKLCDPTTAASIWEDGSKILMGFWDFDTQQTIAVFPEYPAAYLRNPTASSPTRGWEEFVTITAWASPGLVPTPVPPEVSWFQRPEDDQRSQRRRVTLTHDGAQSVAGIVLHGKINNIDGSNWAGYALQLGTGSPALLRITRAIAGVEQIIARLDPTSFSAVISTGVAHTLDLEVFPMSTSDPDGSVGLRARLDGVVVPMTSNASGVVVASDSTVVDTGSSRITRGGLSGFYFRVIGSPSYLDNWVTDTVGGGSGSSGGGGTGGGPAVNADDFSSWPIAAESEGAFGQLDAVLSPSWSLQRRVLAYWDHRDMEGGQVQRLALASDTRRIFVLQYRNASMVDPSDIGNSEIEALRSFWDSHDGPAMPFFFDPSGFLSHEVAGIFSFVDERFIDGIQSRRAQTTFAIVEHEPVGSTTAIGWSLVGEQSDGTQVRWQLQSDFTLPAKSRSGQITRIPLIPQEIPPTGQAPARQTGGSIELLDLTAD